MASPTAFNFWQPVLSGPGPKLNTPTQTSIIPESKLSSESFNKLGLSATTGIIGLAPGYSKRGKIVALALTNGSSALIVEFTGPGSRKARNAAAGSKKGASARYHGDDDDEDDETTSNTTSDSGTNDTTSSTTNPRRLLEEKILCNPTITVGSFDLGPMAMGLHTDLGVKLNHAIDIQDAFRSDDQTTDRRPTSAIAHALEWAGAKLEKVVAKKDRINSEFMNAEYEIGDRKCHQELACRAWLAHFLLSECLGTKVEELKKVDTEAMGPAMLDMVAKTYLDGYRGTLSKSTTVQHRVAEVRTVDGNTQLNAASYKHRFRGEGMQGRMVVTNERGTYVVHGTLNATKEGAGLLKTAESIKKASLGSVTVIEATGKDDPTLAEARRDATLLSVLQGDVAVFKDNPWIANIWFPPPDGYLVWPPLPRENITSPTSPSFNPPRQPQQPQGGGRAGAASSGPPYQLPKLNGSQQKAVNSMLSTKDAHRLVVVQGPPGTGKTSVIASYVIMASRRAPQDGIWLIAQSNVAVKNIALKLLAVGFHDWKILVSKDFHNGWHEHLYTEDPRFNGHLILSNSFKFLKKKHFIGCNVVLATLSMLSNMFLGNITTHIPINYLIVDEASQIDIGAYVAALTTFYRSLRKICFIGDNKQLPPHGQEQIESLQSIFEVPHLERLVTFLDTQYRMPPEIGDIISSTVYDSKLKSNPLHPVTGTTISCYFVDISTGTEAKEGTSWKNTEEQAAVIKLSQLLQEEEKEYRIITPYEGQTTAIEKEMQKTPDLLWKDKCFNVDAFQGNEADYIILSLVRSRALGFLDNRRRTNVMLSRCKRGMYIITSKKFMEKHGGESLVGEMLEILEENRRKEKVWLAVQDLEEGRITRDA